VQTEAVTQDMLRPQQESAVTIDQQTPESWKAVLQTFIDANIYQTWSYGAVRWGAQNLSHVVLSRAGNIIAAAQLRIARLPVVGGGIAYLRWGPLCHRNGYGLDPATIAEIITLLRDEYCRQRRLALYIVPNAFRDHMRGIAYEKALARAGFRSEDRLSCYRTIVVDLTSPLELLRKQLNQKWRNQLNRSERNNLVLEVSDGNAGYRKFVELYRAMRERKSFGTSVDVDEFARIQEMLPKPERLQTFIAHEDGTPVGALVCSLLGDTAIYLLGATNERARELKASYFLHWQAMTWLKARGARRYDLGGIDPDTNPGGYHFKGGFGGNEVAFMPSYLHQGSFLSRSAVACIRWRRRATRS
jgi:lipid II:glycine glycyltransferase (peptidoglycan interpeptide bridge formation enzyme)